MTSLVLTNARLVDGRGLIATRADLRIDGSAITGIGTIEERTTDTVVDLEGRTVCPGLMNAHVHLCFDGSIDPLKAFQAEGDVENALRALPRLSAIVARGVTTVRDLGGKAEVILQLAQMVEQGIIKGPKIVPAGRVICGKGGHGHWMGIEIAGIAEARNAAKSMIDAGASVIKVMATAGMMTSGQEAGAPQLEVEEIRACVEEAHNVGIPVAAHSESRLGAANALDAGVDSIEHGHGLDEPLLERMVEEEVTLVPTISCDRVITQKGRSAGIPGFIVDDCARLAPSLEWALQRAIELGVKIAAGNDGGAPLTSSGDLVDELGVYVEMGMTPQAALASATTATAALFGLTDVGLVEEGHRADLLVVSGDPIDSVNALSHPELVIFGGGIIMSEDPESAVMKSPSNEA